MSRRASCRAKCVRANRCQRHSGRCDYPVSRGEFCSRRRAPRRSMAAGEGGWCRQSEHRRRGTCGHPGCTPRATTRIQRVGALRTGRNGHRGRVGGVAVSDSGSRSAPVVTEGDRESRTCVQPIVAASPRRLAMGQAFARLRAPWSSSSTQNRLPRRVCARSPKPLAKVTRRPEKQQHASWIRRTRTSSHTPAAPRRLQSHQEHTAESTRGSIGWQPGGSPA